MQDWCVYLRKLRMELQVQDPDSTISDRSLASKMLRGSGLARSARAQVLWNCGGLCESSRVETVLKVTYSDIQISERRTGQVLPKKKELGREEHRRGDHRGEHRGDHRGREKTSRGQFRPRPRTPGRPTWRSEGSSCAHEVEVRSDEDGQGAEESVSGEASLDEGAEVSHEDIAEEDSHEDQQDGLVTPEGDEELCEV